MNKKYKIGEFSKLCRVTVKTLRHYEELGLLTPAEVDEWTGYRYYTLDQTQKLNRILHLKRLGLSLEEICDIFERGEDRPNLETIRQKMANCVNELTRLQQQLNELQSLEEFSENRMKMKQTFEIKSIASRIVASHRQVIKTYNDFGELCVGVIGPEMMRLGCTCPEPQYCYSIEHDKEHKDTNIDVEYCEAVGEMHEDTDIVKFYEAPAIPKALCYGHYGPYTTFSESMTKVLAYIQEQGLQIVGYPRFSYIDGPWNKENESEWLTEIQVPVQ